MEAKLTRHHIAAVHRIELHRSGWHERADRNYILGTFWLAGTDLSTQTIRQHLSNHFQIVRPLDVIGRHVNQLVFDRSLIKIGDDAYRLSLAAKDEMDSRVNDAETLEATARSRFIDITTQHCPSLDAIDAWTQFFEHLLVPVIWNTGAQTYDLLTRKSLGNHVAGSLDKFVARFAEDSRAGLIAVVQSFFDPDDVNLRRFILAILNTSFLIRAANSGSDEIAALSSATTKKPSFEIYVDTNYLFCILGLHDNPSNEDAQSLLALVGAVSGSTKIRLRVAPVTLYELRAALTNVELRLAGLRLHMNMAEAVHELGIPGLLGRLADATKAANREISAEELFRPYRDNPVQALRSHGIVPLDNSHGHIKTRQDVIDDIEARREHLDRQGRPRSYAQVEHDMVLWHLTKDLRTSFVESPFDAKYWIVTVDYSFLGFDSYKLRTSGGVVPICMHPATLMQMLQLWVPRSGEMDRAIVGSLRPLFMLSKFDPDAEAVTVRILDTIARYEHSEDLSADTIGAMLINDSLRSSMAMNKTQSERIEMIRDALVEELARASEQLEAQSASIEARAVVNSANEEVLLQKIASLESSLDSSAQEQRHLEAELSARKHNDHINSVRKQFAWRWLIIPVAIAAIVSSIVSMAIPGGFSPLLASLLFVTLVEIHLWWLYPVSSVDSAIADWSPHRIACRARLIFFPMILLILFAWSIASNAAWSWVAAMFPDLAPPP